MNEPLQRFMAKVDVTDGCWIWVGAMNSGGYGVFWLHGHLVGAHRASYLLHVGSIPEGRDLDHLCRVRRCVNPDHLEPVTRRENLLRGLSARPPRTHCRKGHELRIVGRLPDGQCRACRRAAWSRYVAKSVPALEVVREVDRWGAPL